MDFYEVDVESKRRKNLAAEKIRLLAMTEPEAMKKGSEVWYSRMRCLRENEAVLWLKEISRKALLHIPITRKYGKKRSYSKWDD